MGENAENDAPFETVTKLQAAERQLRVAIRLFFERRDLIAVHTLGAAALQVLQDLGRPRGIKGIKDADFIRPERKKEVTNLFNEPESRGDTLEEERGPCLGPRLHPSPAPPA